MKELIKKIIPEPLLSLYHKTLAIIAAFWYRHPSREMIVIGVTGTKGKSTTSNIIWKLLTDEGYTVGLTGTINVRVGKKNTLSTNKMTMVGRFQMQKLLREMVKAGCTAAVIETTSEGIKQWRHYGIQYDIGVFTNLTPEHLDAHGGFENYKKAKLQLFEHIARSPKKVISGQEVARASVVFMDSEHGKDFAAVGDYNKVSVGSGQDVDVQISEVQSTTSGTTFALNQLSAFIPLLGEWNAMNAAMAVGVGTVLDVSLEHMVKSLKTIEQVPGRMEFVDAGQPFSVIVDYAYETVSLSLLYEFCRKLIDPGRRMITLMSSTGGGRDIGRRSTNGAVAAKYCDYVIVTDEDPYDDDPQEIIDQVAEGAKEAGKEEGKNMWKVLDRREAIKKACSLAQSGDLVILTCKGAEQKMCVKGGKKIDWDDREVAREIINGMK